MEKFLHHIKFIIVLIIVLCVAPLAMAQNINTTPQTSQTVRVGSEVTYTVFGYPGSTVYFYVDGYQQGRGGKLIPNNRNNITYNNKTYNKVTFTRTWNSIGNYTLTAQEIAATGCQSEVLTLNVTVKVGIKISNSKITAASCSNVADGKINITVDGEKSAYSFKNSNGIDLNKVLLSNRKEFTIEGWMKLTVNRGYGTFGFAGQNDVIEFGIEGGRLRVWTQNDNRLSGVDYPNDKEWHHIAATGDGSHLKVYLDGELKRWSNNSVANYGTNNNYTTKIGAGIWGATGQSLQGDIANVRFWSVARTQQEIKEGMDNLVSGNEDGLMAAYRFDDSSRSFVGVGADAETIAAPSDVTNISNKTFKWTKTGESKVIATSEDLVNVAAGNYTVTVTAGDNSVTEDFTVGKGADITPEITPKNIVAVVGREYTYSTPKNTGNTYSWTATPTADMQFKNAADKNTNNTATVIWNKAQEYKLKVTESNGTCDGVDEITVQVVDALHLLLVNYDANKCVTKNTKTPFEFTVKRDEKYKKFEGSYSFKWKIISGEKVLVENKNTIQVTDIAKTINVELPKVTENTNFKIKLYDIKDSNDAAYIYPEIESEQCTLHLSPNPSEIKF